jgi:hypothetical protein
MANLRANGAPQHRRYGGVLDQGGAELISYAARRVSRIGRASGDRAISGREGRAPRLCGCAAPRPTAPVGTN